MSEPPQDNQLDLMQFVNKLAGNDKWTHQFSQYLPDGRLIIHLTIEKTKICLVCGKPFNEEHKYNCINNKK